MNKILVALHSRTAWTALLMVIVNILPNLTIDPSLKDLINGILGALIVYFRVTATNIPVTPVPPVV